MTVKGHAPFRGEAGPLQPRIWTGGRNGAVSKSVVPLYGDRGFESVFLQQRVSLSAASAFEGREPRLSARVCAAGLATRSAETRRAFQFAPTCGNISVGAIFQYRSAADVVGENATPIPAKSGLPRFNVRQIFEFGSGSGKAEHGALIVPSERQT